HQQEPDRRIQNDHGDKERHRPAWKERAVVGLHTTSSSGRVHAGRWRWSHGSVTGGASGGSSSADFLLRMNAPMKTLRLLLPLSLLLLLTTASTAQQMCPCFPRENMWTVKTCDGFPCASTMLTAANGDPLTFIMPVGVDDQRWIVMRRVVSVTYTDD